MLIQNRIVYDINQEIYKQKTLKVGHIFNVKFCKTVATRKAF